MSTGEFQIGPETFVLVRVSAFDAEGETAGEPELFAGVFGMGQMLPEVERALDGRRSGETVEVTLGERDAYGARDPGRILEVDRADFPPDASPGDRFEVENVEGEVMIFHVLDVQPECVVVDTNHPLAGQEVRFRLEIRDVRPASEAEIEAAEAALEEISEPELADVPHVSASSLIRGAPSR